MGKVAAIMAGALVLALVAGGMTEATLAVGHRQATNDDGLLNPGLIAAPSASPSPSSKSTPKPSASETPEPSTAPTPSAVTAVTNSFVHLRASTSTSSNILENLNGGTTVVLLSYSDPEWQEVQVDGLTGYVFKTYLTY